MYLAATFLLRDVGHRDGDFEGRRGSARARRQRVRLCQRLAVVRACVLVRNTVRRGFDSDDQHVRRAARGSATSGCFGRRIAVLPLLVVVAVVELPVHCVLLLRRFLDLQHDRVALIALKKQRRRPLAVRHFDAIDDDVAAARGTNGGVWGERRWRRRKQCAAVGGGGGGRTGEGESGEKESETLAATSVVAARARAGARVRVCTLTHR